MMKQVLCVLFPSTLLIDGFNGGYSSCIEHRARVQWLHSMVQVLIGLGPVHRTSPILVCWSTELHGAKLDRGLEKLGNPSRISTIFAPESS
jgi:hypothetical protein